MTHIVIEWNPETKKYKITKTNPDGTVFVKEMDPEVAEYTYGFRG